MSSPILIRASLFVAEVEKGGKILLTEEQAANLRPQRRIEVFNSWPSNYCVQYYKWCVRWWWLWPIRMCLLCMTNVHFVQLPLSLLRTAQGHPIVSKLLCICILFILLFQLVELKNGETYNGHLVNCDSWMNINLRKVIHTSKVTESRLVTWCTHSNLWLSIRTVISFGDYQRHTLEETQLNIYAFLMRLLIWFLKKCHNNNNLVEVCSLQHE